MCVRATHPAMGKHKNTQNANEPKYQTMNMNIGAECGTQIFFGGFFSLSSVLDFIIINIYHIAVWILVGDWPSSPLS